MERIIVNNLSKSFKNNTRSKNFLARLVSPSIKEKKEKFCVLKDISLKVDEGEMLGIIGKNGSGKTTLLRLIAGIYEKDSGSIKLNGNLISVINLFIGIEDRFPMKENVYSLCTILGLRNKEIKKRYKQIIEFAELKEFEGVELYKFSNGMIQRLIFSIIVHCDFDILLLDEVLEFGDESFKSKCIDKIQELLKKGVSIIFVSHGLESIKNYCNRAVWIDDAVIKEQGEPSKVVDAYLNSLEK
jgi:ABC-type polysaccharide/polyol phosphate transport system ATPase subunit